MAKKKTKFVLRERSGEAYPFEIAEDLGEDCQGGHWFKPFIRLTFRPAAEEILWQLNHGDDVLYLPGKTLPIANDAVKYARTFLTPQPEGLEG